jgi:NAD(P)-dependent dehydrogenase (short-subunit alcohol dehydrogenase family)
MARSGNGRIALVTGASSGFGAAVARKLAADDWRCILAARRRERLEQLAAEIDGEVEVCDVTEREQVDAMAQRVAERHSAIHLLVNNAGIPGRGGFLDIEPERIEQVVRTNYLGNVWAMLAFLPLLEAGAPSHIVTVASVASVIPGGAGGPYTASKHAQLAFSRAIASDLAPKGIRVHAVKPGFAETEGFPQERFLTNPIVRRMVLTEDEVADAIMRVVRRNRRESFVPKFYAPAGMLAGIIPVTMSRLLGRATRSRAESFREESA